MDKYIFNINNKNYKAKMWNIFKVNNKDTLVFLLLILNKVFTLF